MLKEYDDDFSKLFKMCVLFDYEMDYNKKNIDSVVSFVNNFVSKENLKPIDKKCNKTACRIFNKSSWKTG